MVITSSTLLSSDKSVIYLNRFFHILFCAFIYHLLCTSYDAVVTLPADEEKKMQRGKAILSLGATPVIPRSAGTDLHLVF